MTRFNGKIGHGWRTLAIGAAITVAAGLMGMSRLGEGLANLSYDLLFFFQGDRPHSEVVVVQMDDESHEKLSQPHRAPWSRAVHANAINRLADYHAKGVVFDILFDKPNRTNPANDRLLVQAATNHGKVVFGAQVEMEINGTIITPKLNKPFSDTFRWGIAETASGEDVIRQHYRDNWNHEPSLAWTAVELIEGVFNLDRNQPRWINYYGPPGFIPHYSYYELLSNSIPAAVLSNKVVVIGEKYGLGYTGGSRTDDFRTPYSRWTSTRSPGPEITATTYLNLLHREWLNELPLASKLLLTLVWGTLLATGFLLIRPTTAAAVGAAAAIFVSALAIWLTWRTLFWFPWIVPAFVQVPAAFFWALLAHNKLLQRERQMLQLQLAAAQFRAPTPETEGAKIPAPLAGPLPLPTPVDWRELPTSAPTVVTPLAPGNGPPPIPDHTLVRCIGQGAYGEVWIARDAIGTYHAVKIVHRNHFRDAAPFEREFRGIQKFTPISRSHAGFLHILHVGRDDRHGHFYYIMELGDDAQAGQKVDPATYSPRTLAQELRQRGQLPLEESLDLALNLCSALEHLHHHKLIHRDIKPANIVFVDNVPKLADIGLVTDISEGGREVTLVGTPEYICAKTLGTPAADLYSLGKVIYQAYTGASASQFPELPTAFFRDGDSDPLLTALNQLVLQACHQDLTKRFQSAAEMHTHLSQLRARSK